MKQLLAVLFLLLVSVPAYAVNPDEVLDDPALEERAREISTKLRCLVCQNQSIDDSDADLARDLRVIVRERLTEGDSNAQVVDFVVDRYGEFVLLEPRFSARNLLLWATPLLVLLIGAAAVAYRVATVRSGARNAKLSAEEERRISEILAEGEGRGG